MTANQKIPNQKTNFTNSIFTLIFCLLPLCAFTQYLPESGIYHWLKTPDGLNLYALELGNRNAEETYVVLHGGFGAEHSYLIKPLLQHTEELRFILFDQRGSLRSPAPDSLITFKGFINDVELIRKEFNLTRVNILAHSNGTTIALDYLYHYPEKVKKIILISCPLYILDGNYFQNIDEPVKKYYDEMEKWKDSVNQKIEAMKEKYNLQNKDSLTSIEKTLLSKIEYAANHTHLMKNVEHSENAFFNPDVFSALQKNVTSEEQERRISNLSHALVKSSIPVTMINGEYDIVDPKGNVWSAVAEGLDHLEYILIKNAGHNVWLDQPEEFRSILERILR
ncbi:MAG: alpha/beta hydrolase [Ignavibacteria bacterium]|nr:alpha/beta hydrolase [Ignavibacteria bacterium]